MGVIFFSVGVQAQQVKPNQGAKPVQEVKQIKQSQDTQPVKLNQEVKINPVQTISSSSENISPSLVHKHILLVNKENLGSSHFKISVIVTDHGMSTDVSPRYTIYLGVSSLAEMGNLFADFKISDKAYKFISASKKAQSIYEIKFMEYREEGMFEVTKTIDAKKIFLDEEKIRKDCADDFCDKPLKTSVDVTETIKKSI